jgi:hypothetical protein
MSKDLLVLADEYASATATFAKSLALKEDTHSMSPTAVDAGDKRMELADAIAAWNTRAAQPDCRTCGKYAIGPSGEYCLTPYCTNGDQYIEAPRVVLWRTE